MGKSTPALILYFASCLVYVFSVAFHWDAAITLLVKPIITPAIYFYYWQESSGRVGLLPSLVIWFFFIGDMLILVEFENLLIPLILLNLSAYLIIGYYLTKDILRLKNPEISSHTILIICLVIAFLLSLLYAALTLVFTSSDANYELLAVYGIILVLLAIETVLFYILKNNQAGFFLAISVLCLVVCDLFYVLYNYYAQLEVFIIINVFCQAFSFYFIVKYFLYRNELLNLEEKYE
ncbi:hypothetical protein LZZ90_10945 [Flavobacterium sp. SM15]|uniref:hypothetical protein n=1 Tax=Flavobacterium sp. SM15 TaxID=2908005 RepID=UPI001EDB846D|nr:hypothetical protein [Flavobacterium sp. SM15]MCG2612024.1 hypothetical protein [Flavobacterium sp. SM15]